MFLFFDIMFSELLKIMRIPLLFCGIFCRCLINSFNVIVPISYNISLLFSLISKTYLLMKCVIEVYTVFALVSISACVSTNVCFMKVKVLTSGSYMFTISIFSWWTVCSINMKCPNLSLLSFV
jgi:hypothetical protein